MMQSSGTAEGLRGLLDSSLLKSVKKIMQHRSTFGPSALALGTFSCLEISFPYLRRDFQAINIMAIFVHNEPTCLPVIQEAELPEVFYSIIEEGLEPIIEVIQSVPNAIGALCLNQAGQEQLNARPNTIPSLFSIFTSEEHQRVLQEKENAVLIGTSIEELIRHHPSLKDKVFAAIKTTMGKIEELGNAFVIPDDIKHWYKLQPEALAPGEVPSTDADVEMEVDSSATTEPASAVGAQPQPATEPSSARDDFFGRSHDNLVISYIDVFGKVIQRAHLFLQSLIVLLVPRGLLPTCTPLSRLCRGP